VSKEVFLIWSIDAELRAAYEAALGEAGAAARWFAAPADLDTVTGDQPSVVAVDIDALPGRWEKSLERLRSAHPGADFVALSSADSATHAMRCLRAGFADFLAKPVSPEELVWCLERSESRRGSQTQGSHPGLSTAEALSRLATAGTEGAARAIALEAVRAILSGRGAAWLRANTAADSGYEVLMSVPRAAGTLPGLRGLGRRAEFPRDRWQVAIRGGSRRAFYRQPGVDAESVYVWDIDPRPTRARLVEARLVLVQVAAAILNLRRFRALKQATFIDDLTGLYNGRYLKFALGEAFTRVKRTRRHFSVLFIDVDHFKRINDTHGHLVGSQFLVTLAKTIKNAVRDGDSVFRYGGDEFVVILKDAGLDLAHDIAERIRVRIERRDFLVGDHPIRTTVSIGLAAYPEHAQALDQLLRLADEAMYGAKRASRNAVFLASGEGGPPIAPERHREPEKTP